MRARDFIRERSQHRGGIDVEEHEDAEDPSAVWITASAHGRELGRVKFYRQGDTVVAQSLEVKPEYRGQGIAKIMYDYAKEQGYKILRSAEQTDAGYQFWERNRPGQGVWEQEVTEEQLDELSFLGSQCTVDCSGHRAGYEWYKRKGRDPNSWSPSFNKGAALAKAGK